MSLDSVLSVLALTGPESEDGRIRHGALIDILEGISRHHEWHEDLEVDGR